MLKCAWKRLYPGKHLRRNGWTERKEGFRKLNGYMEQQVPESPRPFMGKARQMQEVQPVEKVPWKRTASLSEHAGRSRTLQLGTS